MKLLLVLSAAFVIATQAVVPLRGKALEDDVAAAIAQVNNQDVVTLELANALDFFSLRVDLEIKPISIDIIEQLNTLNISEPEVTQMQSDFDVSFNLIVTGVRDVGNRLRNLRSTIGSMHDALQISDWNQLRNQESRFRSDVTTINTNYDKGVADLKQSLITLENDLVMIIAKESTEDAAAVLSNWNVIIDSLEYASREVTDWKVIFDARVVETRSAVDAVLDQVKKSH